MGKRVVLGLLLLSGIAGLPSLALAADGRVLFVAGDAAIERQGKKLPAQKGMTIETGDVMVTGAGARLQWRMADDSYYALRQNSRFEIKEYAASESESGGGKAVYNLVRGGIRVLSGLIGKGSPEAFKLTTPVATLGIRGTDFTTIACAGDCQGPAGASVQDGAYVRVDAGAAEASNADGSATAKAKEYITINSPPQAGSEMPAVFFSWKADFAFEFDVNDLEIEKLRIETEFSINDGSVSPN